MHGVVAVAEVEGAAVDEVEASALHVHHVGEAAAAEIEAAAHLEDAAGEVQRAVAAVASQVDVLHAHAAAADVQHAEAVVDVQVAVGGVVDGGLGGIVDPAAHGEGGVGGAGLADDQVVGVLVDGAAVELDRAGAVVGGLEVAAAGGVEVDDGGGGAVADDEGAAGVGAIVGDADAPARVHRAVDDLHAGAGAGVVDVADDQVAGHAVAGVERAAEHAVGAVAAGGVGEVEDRAHVHRAAVLDEEALAGVGDAELVLDINEAVVKREGGVGACGLPDDDVARKLVERAVVHGDRADAFIRGLGVAAAHVDRHAAHAAAGRRADDQGAIACGALGEAEPARVAADAEDIERAALDGDLARAAVADAEELVDAPRAAGHVHGAIAAARFPDVHVAVGQGGAGSEVEGAGAVGPRGNREGAGGRQRLAARDGVGACGAADLAEGEALHGDVAGDGEGAAAHLELRRVHVGVRRAGRALDDVAGDGEGAAVEVVGAALGGGGAAEEQVAAHGHDAGGLGDVAPDVAARIGGAAELKIAVRVQRASVDGERAGEALAAQGDVACHRQVAAGEGERAHAG